MGRQSHMSRNSAVIGLVGVAVVLAVGWRYWSVQPFKVAVAVQVEEVVVEEEEEEEVVQAPAITVAPAPVVPAPVAPAPTVTPTTTISQPALVALFKLARLSKPADFANAVIKHQLQSKLGELSKADLQRVGIKQPNDVKAYQTKLQPKLRQPSTLAVELASAEQLGDKPGAVFLTLIARTPKEAAAGCRALASLADGSEESQKQLGVYGACEAVLNAYQRFGAQDLDVTFLACSAIAMLAFYCDANQFQLCQLGACEAVVDALRRACQVDQIATQRICFAVSVLATDQANRTRLARLGATEAVVDALHCFGAGVGPELAQHSLAALQQLAEEDDVKVKLVTLGAPKLIVHLVTSLGQRHVEVGREACGLIQNFAADSSGKIQFLLGVSGACEAVVGVLKRFGQQDELLCQYACGSIQNLAVYPLNQEKLGQAGACEAVLGALGRFGERDANVAYFGCAALRHLAVSPGNLAKLRALGAKEVVAKCGDETETKLALMRMLT